MLNVTTSSKHHLRVRFCGVVTRCKRDTICCHLIKFYLSFLLITSTLTKGTSSFRLVPTTPRTSSNKKPRHPFHVAQLLLPSSAKLSPKTTTLNSSKPDQDDNSNDRYFEKKDKCKTTAICGDISLTLSRWIGTVCLALLILHTSTTDAVFAEEPAPPPVTDISSTTKTTSTTSSNMAPALGFVQSRRYWTIQKEGTDEERITANKVLLEHVVRTVNTMYYDRTAGVEFTPEEYYSKFRSWLRTDPTVQQSLSTREGTVSVLKTFLIHRDALPDLFARYLTREELKAELITRYDGFLGLGAVVEMPGSNPFIEDVSAYKYNNLPEKKARKVTDSLSFIRNHYHHSISSSSSSRYTMNYLNPDSVENLPVITAVVPYSPAERAGLTVGDRIVAVQDDSFLSLSRQMVASKLQHQYSAEENQYFGYTELTVAKPVTIYSTSTAQLVVPKSQGDTVQSATLVDQMNDEENYANTQSTVVVFRPTRVRLPTVAASRSTMYADNYNNYNQDPQQSEIQVNTNNNDAVTSPELMPASALISDPVNPIMPNKINDDINDNFIPDQESRSNSLLSGGNEIVRWQLLTHKGSIFIDDLDIISGKQQEQSLLGDDLQQMVSFDADINENAGMDFSSTDAPHEIDADDNRNFDTGTGGVGYIRLSRFSRTAVSSFVEAVNELEALGAQSYIVDLRNNYGGNIQSAMMMASSLLRDPHDVVGFTINNRCGCSPVTVDEFVLDKFYPGYLLSRESPEATLNQLKEENPNYFVNMGGSPSLSASLPEQNLKRGTRSSVSSRIINRDRSSNGDISSLSSAELIRLRQQQAQKPLVLLINEGTASSAEVFASALHDNGRTVALVGAKTYGKGLIQHTFPLPDGGGLRLTVAEYLTPAVRHVSRIGGAQFDPITGEWVGGGIRPDIVCDSKQGIPNNIGADLCVGMALDALEEYSQ